MPKILNLHVLDYHINEYSLTFNLIIPPCLRNIIFYYYYKLLVVKNKNKNLKIKEVIQYYNHKTLNTAIDKFDINFYMNFFKLPYKILYKNIKLVTTNIKNDYDWNYNFDDEIYIREMFHTQSINKKLLRIPFLSVSKNKIFQNKNFIITLLKYQNIPDIYLEILSYNTKKAFDLIIKKSVNNCTCSYLNRYNSDSDNDIDSNSNSDNGSSYYNLPKICIYCSEYDYYSKNICNWQQIVNYDFTIIIKFVDYLIKEKIFKYLSLENIKNLFQYPKFINKVKSILNWKLIVKRIDLTFDIILKFKKYILKFKNLINWGTLTNNSKDFINKNLHIIVKNNLLKNLKLEKNYNFNYFTINNIQCIKKYKNYFNWKEISDRGDLNKKFIANFISLLDKKKIFVFIVYNKQDNFLNNLKLKQSFLIETYIYIQNPKKYLKTKNYFYDFKKSENNFIIANSYKYFIYRKKREYWYHTLRNLKCTIDKKYLKLINYRIIDKIISKYTYIFLYNYHLHLNESQWFNILYNYNNLFKSNKKLNFINMIHFDKNRMIYRILSINNKKKQLDMLKLFINFT